jgi:hypothetical protein
MLKPYSSLNQASRQNSGDGECVRHTLKVRRFVDSAADAAMKTQVNCRVRLMHDSRFADRRRLTLAGEYSR